MRPPRSRCSRPRGSRAWWGRRPCSSRCYARRRRQAHAPRLRFAMAGGAALATEVARSIEETFQCALREGYGMSEVGGGIAGAPLTSPRKPRSVGPAFPGSEIRIVDLATRAPLPVGERGEVQVRSPSVMRGYRSDEEATKAVVDRDGWLSTGDIGYVDDDGYLFLVDRQQGPHHPLRLQRLPGRGRGGAVLVPRRARGGGRRRPGRGARRGGGRAGRPRPRRRSTPRR